MIHALGFWLLASAWLACMRVVSSLTHALLWVHDYLSRSRFYKDAQRERARQALLADLKPRGRNG